MGVDLANLRLRVISALVLAPLVLVAVYLGGWIFVALVVIATGAALFEWLRIVAPQTPKPIVYFSLVCLAAIVAAAGWRPEMATNGVLLAFVLTVAVFLWSLHDSRNKTTSLLTAFGIPYLAGSGFALVYLREQPDAGLMFVVYVLLVVWGTDIGAYATGRLIGGPKLAPRISPKKTWAGLFGGMALAAFLGYIAAVGFGAQQPLAAMLVALLLAVVAQIGDLFKSYFKRRAGVKDSGCLIPGHGGVLDRIDGLVFAALFFALFEDVMIGQW